MYSGHRDSDHSQTDRPSIHRINVMENTESKKADDGLGDYKKANAGKGADEGKVDGGVDQQKEGEGTEKVTDKDKGRAGQADEAKKETLVIVDPTAVNSSKGDCCTRFKKFCAENKCLVALVCILIFLTVLFFGLYIDTCRRSKADKESMTPPTSSPGVTTETTSTPGSTASITETPTPQPTFTIPTEPPVSKAVIQGTITTANNYTAALADPTSLAFKSFENSFSAAMIGFYAENHPEYIGYYEDTIVSMIESSGQQTVVQFEIQFSQLDNDDALPDAHTELSDQLNQGRLGTFLIVDVGSLTKS